MSPRCWPTDIRSVAEMQQGQLQSGIQAGEVQCRMLIQLTLESLRIFWPSRRSVENIVSSRQLTVPAEIL